jgi:plasmid stabilization system protein ParE
MTRYRFTPQALNDLFEIWSFIAQDNSAAADRVEDAVYRACEFVAEMPLAGTVRTDLMALPVRFWPISPFPNYFIVYDAAARPVEILRVLHGARDIRSLLP